MADILGRRNLPLAEAFAVLRRHFGNINGAGINLTEILHTRDKMRFAVRRRGWRAPRHPGLPSASHKAKRNAESYARYCEHADAIRRSLGLDDFTELEALFNYAYWRETEEGETAT